MQTLTWRERAAPPTPAGLVATGAAARAVVAALGARDKQGESPGGELQGLRVAATLNLLVVLGEANLLPWADGVRYCAPDARAPGLWLPTLCEPVLPADLVHAALRRRGACASMLLWPDPSVVLPLDDALPVDSALLAWLGGAFA